MTRGEEKRWRYSGARGGGHDALAERGVLRPEGCESRGFEGRAYAFQNVEGLKAAADDVIEQHFNCNYDAKVAG